MNRWMLATLLLFPSLAPAAEKPATLTAREAAEGWILLFDGTSTFGWHSADLATWRIADGMLTPQGLVKQRLITNNPFSAYQLAFEFRQLAEGKLELFPCCDESGKPLAEELPTMLNAGTGWHRYKLEVDAGAVISEELSDLTGGSVTNRGPAPKRDLRAGHLALGGHGFVIRNIKLRPTNTRPLFNGKDLSGWRLYTRDKGRQKSTFTVTSEGWLSLKNGPGDLQTEGQWANFLLQLDCKTNGVALNSGVFFRCLPREYQQGYEAQIHNQFGEAPGKEYALDVFDPATNKLKEKRKERYLATDYGTGAIYRRQPARLQAARDNEWFTMTVIAHGRHFATWVNGRQTVDWTDHRPRGDNARNGAYLKKGAISLQGHDPTTDLLFRNLRLAPLPD